MLSRDLDGRRFTTSVNHIVARLPDRAADRGMTNDFTEQTAVILALWTILRWERKVGLVALERVGVEIDALARDVDRVLNVSCAEIPRQLGPPKLLTNGAGGHGMCNDYRAPLGPLLAAAEDEALGLSHNYVGDEHLVLAIVRLAGPPLREVLDEHGISHEGVRQAALALLQA